MRSAHCHLPKQSEALRHGRLMIDSPPPPVPPRSSTELLTKQSEAWSRFSSPSGSSEEDGDHCTEESSESGDEHDEHLHALLRTKHADLHPEVHALLTSRFPSVEDLAHLCEEDLRDMHDAFEEHHVKQILATVESAEREAAHNSLSLLLDLGLSLEEAVEVSTARKKAGAARHRARCRVSSFARDASRSPPLSRVSSSSECDCSAASASSASGGGPAAEVSAGEASAGSAAATATAAVGTQSLTDSEDEESGDSPPVPPKRKLDICEVPPPPPPPPPRTGGGDAAAVAESASESSAARSAAAYETCVGTYYAFCSVGPPEVPVGTLSKIIAAASFGKRQLLDDRIRSSCIITLSRVCKEDGSVDESGKLALKVEATAVTKNSISTLACLETDGVYDAPKLVTEKSVVCSSFGDSVVMPSAYHLDECKCSMGGGWMRPSCVMFVVPESDVGGVVESDGEFTPPHDDSVQQTDDPLAERIDWMLGPSRQKSVGAEEYEWCLFGDVTVTVLGRATSAYFAATRTPLKLWRPIRIATLTAKQHEKAVPPPPTPRRKSRIGRKSLSPTKVAAKAAELACAAAAVEKSVADPFVYLNLVSGEIVQVRPVPEEELLPERTTPYMS